MARPSPIRSGFRAIWRTPTLVLAEITWRWSFAVSTVLLLFLALVEFLRSVDVPDTERMFLRSGSPLLIAGALSNIFQGSGGRLLRIGALLVPALILLWTFAAALGRAATMSVLLPGKRMRVRSLLGQSFLRAVLALAAVISVIGSAMIAGNMIRPERTMPVSSQMHAAVMFSLAVLAVVAIIWSALNWLLSLAAVPVGLEGRDALEGIRAAVVLLQRKIGALLGAGTVFGLLRLAALIAATVIALVIAGMAPRTWDAIGVIATILVYLAFADMLYVARLASYVAIAEDDLAPQDAPTNDATDEPQLNAPAAPAIPSQ